MRLEITATGVILLILGAVFGIAIGMMFGHRFLTSMGMATGPIKIYDAFGRQLVLEKVPHRVVSLSPTITETLFALGLGDKVVGVDKYSNYPPEVVKLVEEGKIKIIGSYWEPDFEKIVECNPDLVIADISPHGKYLEKFDELGLNVLFVHGGAASSIEDIISDILTIAKTFGVEDKGEELVANIREKVNMIREKVANATKVKVLILLGPPAWGLWSTGAGTFIDNLVTLAGGTNVFAKYHGWIQTSYEEILAQDPEVIIITVMGTDVNTEELLMEVINTPLNATKAAEKGRIYILTGVANDILCRPGPRVIEALEMLGQIIHPEIFGETQREDVSSLKAALVKEIAESGVFPHVAKEGVESKVSFIYNC